MSGRAVKAYIDELCRTLDAWATGPLRRAALVAALPAAALSASCDDSDDMVLMYGVPAYGVPYEDEICDDGLDNDDNGDRDCDDPACESLELCLGCDDGYDNDGHELSDCGADASCAGAEACVGACDDGVDDDGDGLTDCADPDCTGSPACS